MVGVFRELPQSQSDWLGTGQQVQLRKAATWSGDLMSAQQIKCDVPWSQASQVGGALAYAAVQQCSK